MGHREVIARLDAVVHEVKARLVLINGRLDEAMGRAVETAGRAGRAGRGRRRRPRSRLRGAGGDLRGLRDALEEVAPPGPDRRGTTRPVDQPGRATSAD